MNIINIITKKKNNEQLTYEEIKYAVESYLSGDIKDYQMSSLLMAIVINGMTEEETISLTKVMIESGDTLDLSDISDVVVDKHSTGGVGDKTTLILVPLVASTGLKIAKMSGRGLGHTGGTIDKLEAIEGFKVNLEEEEFKKQIKEIGLAVISQTSNLVPADKKIYALRDVTGTTESIPLIASSIMSKKIASGANIIVIDVKVGNGALMKNIEDAKTLANLMIKIGSSYNRKVVCVLTDMSEPLGCAIGNGLEVVESIELLKGNGPSDLKELVLTLATEMVSLGKNISKVQAKEEVLNNLNNGKALEKFKQLVSYQKGDLNNINISSNTISIKSSKTGFVRSIDALKLGELSRILKAGRINSDDVIDYGVGIVLNKKVGDYVLENEELLKIYFDDIFDDEDKKVNLGEINTYFDIEESSDNTKKLIIDIIS